MNIQAAHSIHQTSSSNFHAPEILEETDVQVMTRQLLDQLHEALDWQKQTLTEAAEEIQGLLKQLEQTNPIATKVEQDAFVTAAISPTRREQFVNALQAGWKEMIQEFLDSPYLSLGIAILEEWKKAE